MSTSESTPVASFKAAFSSFSSGKFNTINLTLSVPGDWAPEVMKLIEHSGLWLQVDIREPVRSQNILWRTRRYDERDMIEMVGYTWPDGSPILDDQGYPYPTYTRAKLALAAGS